MKTAAIIPARGGSVRLRRKNVRQFCGLPLVEWSIIQALCSHRIDRVFLCTDDKEIAAIGEKHGAEIIMQPDWGAGSSATRATSWSIAAIEERGFEAERIVCLLPTSPLRYPEDIDKGIAKHEQTGFHLSAMARRRETFLFRDIHGMVARQHTFDKSGSYLQDNSGLYTVYDASWLKWCYPLWDSAVDELGMSIDEMVETNVYCPKSNTHYEECALWQCTETDTLEEFELAEVLMDLYILKARGLGTYLNYRDEGENDE